MFLSQQLMTVTFISTTFTFWHTLTYRGAHIKISVPFLLWRVTTSLPLKLFHNKWYWTILRKNLYRCLNLVWFWLILRKTLHANLLAWLLPSGGYLAKNGKQRQKFRASEVKNRSQFIPDTSLSMSYGFRGS